MATELAAGVREHSDYAADAWGRFFRTADFVLLLAYGGGRTVDMWWQANRDALLRQDKLTVKSVSSTCSKALAAMADRALDLQCMIQDGEIWFSDANERVLVEISQFMPAAE